MPCIHRHIRPAKRKNSCSRSRRHSSTSAEGAAGQEVQLARAGADSVVAAQVVAEEQASTRPLNTEQTQP